MDRFLHLNSPAFLRKAGAAILALSFFLGLILGAVFSVLASDTLLPTMRAALDSRVSISGLLSAVLLPFIFSAFAVYIKQPLLLIAAAFVKAFLFSYLGLSISVAFGSAGWLIRWLVMFSDGCLMPFLCWYWLRHISGDRGFSISDASVILISALLIGSIDYCIIAPFLANVIV